MTSELTKICKEYGFKDRAIKFISDIEKHYNDLLEPNYGMNMYEFICDHMKESKNIFEELSDKEMFMYELAVLITNISFAITRGI